MVMAPREPNFSILGVFSDRLRSYSDLDTTSPTTRLSGIFGYQDTQGPGQRYIRYAREEIVSLIIVILSVQK